MNTSAIPDKTSISETFMEMVARYYSQFIHTDFKKGRLPKRRIESKDRKGRRVGVTLSQFRA